MEVALLGTSGSSPIPAFHCTCEVCTQARERGNAAYIRNNSCAQVRDRYGNAFLIDTPPQFMSQLARFHFLDTQIDSIVMTHGHEDHFLGLFYLFFLTEKKGGKLSRPIDIYLGSDTLNTVAQYFKRLSAEDFQSRFASVMRCMTIQEQARFTLGTIDVTPLETDHLRVKDTGGHGFQSFGYHLQEQDRHAYYLLDAPKQLPSRTLDYIREHPPSCMIVDCTYAQTDQSSGHGDVDSAIALRKMFSESRVILSHISHMNMVPDKLEHICRVHDIEVGYDGMKIIV